MQTSALMTSPLAAQSRIARPSAIRSLRAPSAPLAARRNFVVRAEVCSCLKVATPRSSLDTVQIVDRSSASFISSWISCKAASLIARFCCAVGPWGQGQGRIQGRQERRQGCRRFSEGGRKGGQGLRQGWCQGRVSFPKSSMQFFGFRYCHYTLYTVQFAFVVVESSRMLM